MDYPVICYRILWRRVHRMQLDPYRRELAICLFFDFGKNFDQTSQYCSGFPRNRTLRGISIALAKKILSQNL